MNNAMDEILSAAEGGAMTPALKLRLDEIADQVLSIDKQTEILEDQLKALSKDRNNITTKIIPTVLLQCGLNSYSTTSGLEIKLETVCSGSLPKEVEARSKALQLLKDYGAEGIIKTEVSMLFGIGEYEHAKELLNFLQSDGYDTATLQENVHAQTLAAFARERMAANEPIDTEALGLYVAQIAKVKQKKARA